MLVKHLIEAEKSAATLARLAALEFQQAVIDKLPSLLEKNVELTARIKAGSGRAGRGASDDVTVIIEGLNGLIFCELWVEPPKQTGALGSVPHYKVYSATIGLICMAKDVDDLINRTFNQLIEKGLLYVKFISELKSILGANTSFQSSDESWLGKNQLCYVTFNAPFKLPTGKGTATCMVHSSAHPTAGLLTIWLTTSGLRVNGPPETPSEQLIDMTVYGALVKYYKAFEPLIDEYERRGRR